MFVILQKMFTYLENFHDFEKQVRDNKKIVHDFDFFCLLKKWYDIEKMFANSQIVHEFVKIVRELKNWFKKCLLIKKSCIQKMFIHLKKYLSKQKSVCELKSWFPNFWKKCLPTQNKCSWVSKKKFNLKKRFVYF